MAEAGPNYFISVPGLFQEAVYGNNSCLNFLVLTCNFQYLGTHLMSEIMQNGHKPGTQPVRDSV